MLRALLSLGLLAFSAALCFVGSTSCELASREPSEAGDAAEDSEAAPPPPPPMDTGIPSDVDTDCGCCTMAILPLLPFCSGMVAFEMPASDCPLGCETRAAYALCGDGCYTSCACDLPKGYTLVDAGFAVGDASPDGG